MLRKKSLARAVNLLHDAGCAPIWSAGDQIRDLRMQVSDSVSADTPQSDIHIIASTRFSTTRFFKTKTVFTEQSRWNCQKYAFKW